MKNNNLSDEDIEIEILNKIEKDINEHPECLKPLDLTKGAELIKGMKVSLDEIIEDDIDTKTRHITKAGDNIFLDLGFPEEEAEKLKEESNKRIGKK